MLTIIKDNNLYVIVRLTEGEEVGEIVDVCSSIEIAQEDYPDAVLQN